MAYAISRIHITPAKYSVDGKQHRHKLWYAGVKVCGSYKVTAWEKRKGRLLFDRKVDANRMAKHLGDGAVVETVK